MTDGVPVVDPPAGTDADPSGVVGVVLAAGTSSRFGDANKLLATVEGVPLVRRAARTLLDAGMDVVVVLGHDAPAVREALDGLDVSFATNEDYEAGQSTSVVRGVEAATACDADAVLFLPGDMPFVSPGTVEALLAAYRAGAGEALAAASDGTRGNPVLFDRACFDALRAIEGDVGGRSVLLNYDDAALVAVDDPGVRTDIDTRDALDAHR
ncbi:nucleotidyltransferase family protein [Natronomonas gomsonensis]|uniref:nucleotidyltransferase family protein n=1 Tax=Natronomonas gomsonensis TaxID=1046043 RepID=UPI0020CA4FCC|nr:nucleotidyltransferase family protein [Natronomonas gomsonensis]MCY4729717.1 nucleotidyltransferase family protein [Natronomonas gomsonensis]